MSINCIVIYQPGNIDRTDQWYTSAHAIPTAASRTPRERGPAAEVR